MSLVAREAITPTNQSPIFLIITWVLQAAVLGAVAAKTLLLHTSIGLHLDDWCILAAAVLSIGEVVAVSFQGVNGIGKVQSSLSDNNLVVYQKAGYAGEILYLLTLAASKLSVVFFIYNVTPFALYRRIALGIGIFIILWSLAFVFATAFACHNPVEWAFVQGQCINQTTLWISYSCFNIATEIALIAVPFEMFYSLISSLYKKTVLMFCFGLRFIVVAAIAVQIYFICHPVHPPTSSSSNPDSGNNNDFTFSTWPIFLTTQIIQCLSIITTCIPFMKSLFLGMQTGMIQTGHISGRNWSGSGRWKATGRRGAISWHATSRSSGVSSLIRRSRDSSLGSSTTASRQMSEGSSISEPLRSPTFFVGGSGALNPPAPRSNSLSSGPERPYSRREISMIMGEEEEEEVEEEDEYGHEHGLQETVNPEDNVTPDQYLLDTSIPSARLSGLSRISFA